MNKKTTLLVVLLLVLFFVCFIYIFRDSIQPYFFSPRQSASTNTVNLSSIDKKNENIVVFADNLNIPWEIVFLNSSEMLVTQRSGEVLSIKNGTKKVIRTIEDVKHSGEGGLLGIARDPLFSENKYIYLYQTTQNRDEITNRVDRYIYDGEILQNKTTILDGIKGSLYHDGGRIKFLPDGYLYITTGDAQMPELAQDINSLNGKILRIKSDGTIPENNPFGNAVYSYGLRNPQGLTWDYFGRLWSTDHGPSGLQTGYDEFNLIQEGKNYGWPIIKGDETQEGMVSPLIHSGNTDTWAPSGMAFHNGYILFTGLRGEAIYKVDVRDGNYKLTEYFKGEYGRLRTIVVGPDGYFYVATNNTDGRGTPNKNDDVILKVNPDVFN